MSKITKKELHSSLLRLIESGSSGGGSGTLVQKKNTVKITKATSSINIGIPYFDKTTDILMVYKNSVYLEENQDYTISSDSTTINAVDGQWNTQNIEMTFNFVVFKNVPEASELDGKLLKNKTVGLEKLTDEVVDLLDGEFNDVVHLYDPEKGMGAIVHASQDSNTAVIKFFNKNNEDNGYVGLYKEMINIAGGTIGVRGGNHDHQRMAFIPEKDDQHYSVPVFLDFHNNEEENILTARIAVFPDNANGTNEHNGILHLMSSKVQLYGSVVPVRHGVMDIGTTESYINNAHLLNIDLLSSKINSENGVFKVATNSGVELYLQSDESSQYPCHRPKGSEVRLGHAVHMYHTGYILHGVTTGSDKRLKTDIVSLDNNIKTISEEKPYSEKVYDFFKNLPLVKYKQGTPVYEETSEGISRLINVDFTDSKECVGFLADDLVDDEIGETILEENNNSDLLLYNEKQLLNNLLIAFKESTKKIELLEQRVQELEILNLKK